MGQAKRRGTFEQRLAEALARKPQTCEQPLELPKMLARQQKSKMEMEMESFLLLAILLGGLHK